MKERKLSIALAIKNPDGAAIVSIYETLVVSKIGNGFFSVLCEEKKKDEKEGVGFCEENAVFDWISKNYITEELFSVGDEVRLRDARHVDIEEPPYFDSYKVREILDVSSITPEFAMVHLDGSVAAKISMGEKPEDIYKCSQLLKLSAGGGIVEGKHFRTTWWPSVKFTKAPL